MRAELREVAQRFGTPTYVYFMDAVEDRIDELNAAFGGRFKLSYAAKSNPNPALLRWLSEKIPCLDISSGGELDKAVQNGWTPSQISFTGPGKRSFELQAAVQHGVGEVVLESVAEARELAALAREAGRQMDVLVRLAPAWAPMGFGDHMAGKPCPFGVDEEVLEESLQEIQALPGLDLRGFHIYSGTQCLDPEAILANYRNFLAVFRKASDICGLEPRTLIFGSGLGVPYHDNQTPLPLAEVAEPFCEDLDSFRKEAPFRNSELKLELGRYLVGEAGIFLVRVIRTKESRGTKIGICDGGMNNHLAACGHMGMVIPRNYRFFEVRDPDPGGVGEAYNLVGPLCTSLDTLARNVQLSGLQEGDLLGVQCSGAYGVTSSPIYFISHPPPGEVMVETRGAQPEYQDVSQFGGPPGS